jgi:hypothetical protein
MRFSHFLTAAVLVAMGCAQQEQSDDAALGDPEDMPSDGGSSAGKTTGGASQSGASSTAGKASTTAGTSNGGFFGDEGGSGGGAGEATGGGGGSAGKAAGGSGGTGGKAAGGSGGTGGKAAGGSGGTGGKAAGGSGGSSAGTGGAGIDCTPHSGGPVAGLSLRYESEVDGATDTSVGSQISIYNTSGTTFNLADLRVRYYLTNEVAAAMTKSINWAWLRPIAGGETNIKDKLEFNIVDLGCSASGADTYFEFTFKADAGLLAPNQYVLFSWVVSNGASQSFTQGNDYSFNAGQKIDADYGKVVLLQQNLNKLWGTEPAP